MKWELMKGNRVEDDVDDENWENEKERRWAVFFSLHFPFSMRNAVGHSYFGMFWHLISCSGLILQLYFSTTFSLSVYYNLVRYLCAVHSYNRLNRKIDARTAFRIDDGDDDVKIVLLFFFVRWTELARQWQLCGIQSLIFFLVHFEWNLKIFTYWDEKKRDLYNY